MPTKGRQSLVGQMISLSAIAVVLTLTGVFVSGCYRSAASDTSGASTPTPRIEATVAGVILRADPNPVPAGRRDGTTTITWDTGSKDTAGDVYVVDAGKEKLFGSSAKGSQEARWIKPGSTEFRLYKHSDHTLLAQLTVTMLRSPEAVTSASVTPTSSVTP